MAGWDFLDSCFAGNLEEVRIHIANGADVNQVCPVGQTGLMGALSGRENNDVAHLLLQQPHIDVNKIDGTGFSALHRAVTLDNLEMAEVLLARPDLTKTTINHRVCNDMTAIMQTIWCDAVNCSQLLLANPLVDLDLRVNLPRTLKEIQR